MKTISTILVISIFLTIVFRRRLLPVLQKRKKPAETKTQASVQETAFPETEGKLLCCDVLAFNVSCYKDREILCSSMSGELTKKLSEIALKGRLLVRENIVSGNMLLVILTWEMTG